MKTSSFMDNCIRKILLTVGLVASGFMAFSSMAAGAGMKTLHGHVPAIVSQSRDTGRLSTTRTLNLAIGLPLRNQEALTNLLQQIYEPASTNYHRYLSPEQFTAQFGPTKQDYDEVIHFAEANGLVVTGTHPNRMLLDVSGRVSDVEKALHITMHTYSHPSLSRTFFAPDAEPSVPSGLSIQDLSGLDSYRRPHPNIRFKPASQTSGATTGAKSSVVVPNAGSGPGGDYIGNDFRNAYVPGTTLNGSGQTIALVQFDGYFASDINAYETLAGRTNIPLNNVLIDGFNGLPTGSGGEVEVSLDIEMAISMAPALSQVILYEGSPFNFHPNDVLNRIVTDNSARQISCSWGWSGGPTATTDQIFQQMAIQGQTFFDAVGDSDAFTSGAGSVNGVDNPFLPNVPSDSPYITQVGGTTLTMNGAGTSYTSETAWNWDVRFGPSEDGVGSSGGISSFYSIPSWQTNINMTASQGSTTFRNTPDVALTADDVFVIADGGGFFIGVGGTSCASPLWAGFTALVNQQATNNGHASVGFLNPALYAIASGANYSTCFRDITTGNNKWSSSPNLFSAVANYDLCTGLGTPNGTNLINALITVGSGNTITHLSPPPAPYGSTLNSLNGGNPNGTWELFVQDSKAEDDGIISNGWILTLTTANPVGLSADLVLSMTVAPTNVLVGDDVVYTIGVTNYGPSTSSNVVVSDTLPLGGTLLATNNTQGSVSRDGSQVTWNIGTLFPNTGVQLTLTVQANSAGNDIPSLASVTTDTSDANPDDNEAFVAINVGTVVPPQLSGGSVGANGIFQMTVTGSAVQTIIQTSTNLVNWVPIFTNSSPFTSPFVFTDPAATNYPYRFYRAITAQ
jgi:uncharacterized repeat protein (TIGR01451 family)